MDYIHYHNQASGGRSLSSGLRGVWMWVCDEWVDPDGVMTG